MTRFKKKNLGKRQIKGKNDDKIIADLEIKHFGEYKGNDDDRKREKTNVVTNYKDMSNSHSIMPFFFYYSVTHEF